MPAADLILRNADCVLTCAGPAPRTGAAQNDAVALANASVASRDGKILFVGPAHECDRSVERDASTQVIEGQGFTIVPGFVDPHTHAVFMGDRRDELRRRLDGADYAEIAASGGGIAATVRQTRDATEDQLISATRPRLDEMLRCGTTTAEIKSGYGLNVAAELKILSAIRRLGETHPMELVATFLGAHDIPVEFRGRRAAYIDLVVREMLPAVAARRLAEWCDVFCEYSAFTPEESRVILEAGRLHGLKPRVHADELNASGGSWVAAHVKARSADHLVFVPRAGIAALAEHQVVATLLPIAALYLKLGRYAPARSLIEAGVPVALATDVNPGGGFSPSMPFAIALACFAMNMTFEEALVGATINAAYSIDRHETIGSLERGKQMDAVLVRGHVMELIRVGAASIAAVIKCGRVVVDEIRSQGPIV